VRCNLHRRRRHRSAAVAVRSAISFNVVWRETRPHGTSSFDDIGGGSSTLRNTGVDVVLDGNLLVIMEVLYQEVTARRELERSFDDMSREIAT
jgi:hypothetical protein